MLRAISSISGLREEDVLFEIIRSALYPTIFIGQLSRRFWSQSDSKSGVEKASRASVFSQTKEQTSVIASYMVMAIGGF
jgi:hypothetical protein